MIVPLYTYEWYNSQDELHKGGKQNREVWVGERKSVVKLRIFKWRCCWCFKRFIAYEQDYLCEFCKTFWRRREPPALEEKSFSTNSHKWTHTQAKNIQIHIGLFLPGQIPLFISTLSIAISPVNECPTIPSNITCEKSWVSVSNTPVTFYMFISVINQAYTSPFLPTISRRLFR